jgi:hypothetical protein
MENKDERLPSGTGLSSASPIEPVPVSPLCASIPSAAIELAEDVIAMTEDAYEEAIWPHICAGGDAPAIEGASCDTDSVCNWRVCNAVGCIVDKHRTARAFLGRVAMRP